MSTETTCTCPSGDGSLRWPCPAHQPSLITSAGAATAVQPLLASDLVFGHPRELFRVTPAGDIVVSEGVSTTDAVRGFWDAVAQARPRPDAAVLNQPSGNSRQLQQPGAAAGLNEAFGDSEQLARPDAASGGDAHDIEDPCDVITRAAQKLAAAGQPRLADRLVRACDAVEQLQASARDARQPVGVEPAAFVPVHPTFGPMWSDTFPAAHCNDGRSRASERRPLYFASPAQADRMAIKMLVAAGFVSEDKANESLRIAHGFGGDLGQPAPASVPAPDLSRTIAQLNRMRIVLRNARAYVESFTCKSALPPVQQRMIGQIDEVLGALAHAWPTTVPSEGPLSGKYGVVLRPFVAMMERELHANVGKGDRPGWLSMDSSTALLEIYHHMGKLQRATKNADEPGIVEYAADVANMAMMLVDVCGLLPVEGDIQPQPAAACVNINATRYLYLRAQPAEGGPWGTPRIAIPSSERAGQFANGEDADAAIDAAIAAQHAHGGDA